MDANTTTNHERVTQARTENQKWQLAPTWLSFMVLCSSPLWLEESMRVRGAEVACGSQGAATPSAQPLALFLLTTSYRQAKVPPSHGLIIFYSIPTRTPFYKHSLFNSSHPTTHIHSSLRPARLLGLPLLWLCSGQSPSQPVFRSAIERHVAMLKDYAFLGLHVLQFGGFLPRLEALRVQCAVLGA